MVDNSLYKLNQKGLDFLKTYNCQIVMNAEASKIGTRPMFYAFKIDETSNLVYLIPLTTIRSEEQKANIEKKMNGKGIQVNFYALGKVMGKLQGFKISSVFVVDETMVDEWTISSKLYTIQNKVLIEEIQKKLKIMLNYYKSSPERSENHVIMLKDELIK